MTIDHGGDDSETALAPQPEKRPAAAAEPGLRLGLLDTLLGYQLRRAQLAAFQSFAETMEPFGVSPGQFGVLVLVDANPGLNQTALGRALGIERSSVVAVLDRLCRRGLVKRTAHDRRSHALFLTPDGKELLRKARPPLEAHERRIASALSPDEARTLMALLRRVGAG